MKSQAILFVLLFFTFSCDTTDPPPPPPPPPLPYVRSIDLSVVDTGLTDAYLRVRFLDTAQTRAFRLHRDGQPVLTATIAGMDTVLLQDSLGIHNAHNYRAYRLRDTLVIDSSLSVSLTTLDTTSHNFTFQSFQFGEHSSSVFNDVAIIDENNIWAVGEVYLRDSTGATDPILYNVARWNGTGWDLQRVMFPGECGQPATGPEVTRSVLAFGANDVWIASPGLIARWNGNGFIIHCIPPEILAGSIKEIWGENSNSVYVVGNFGTIAYWNGSVWSSIESNTDLPIQDIWGAVNPRTGNTEVFCVASRQGVTTEKKLIRLETNTAYPVPDSGIAWPMLGVWFMPERQYFVVGSGIHHKQQIEMNTPWLVYPPGVVTNYRSDAIRGNGLNDIIVTGSFGEVVHFNGSTWTNYYAQTQISGSYLNVAIQENLFVTVGYTSNKACVVFGRR